MVFEFFWSGASNRNLFKWDETSVWTGLCASPRITSCSPPFPRHTGAHLRRSRRNNFGYTTTTSLTKEKRKEKDEHQTNVTRRIWKKSLAYRTGRRSSWLIGWPVGANGIQFGSPPLSRHATDPWLSLRKRIFLGKILEKKKKSLLRTRRLDRVTLRVRKKSQVKSKLFFCPFGKQKFTSSFTFSVQLLGQNSGRLELFYHALCKFFITWIKRNRNISMKTLLISIQLHCWGVSKSKFWKWKAHFTGLSFPIKNWNLFVSQNWQQIDEELVRGFSFHLVFLDLKGHGPTSGHLVRSFHLIFVTRRFFSTVASSWKLHFTLTYSVDLNFLRSWTSDSALSIHFAAPSDPLNQLSVFLSSAPNQPSQVQSFATQALSKPRPPNSFSVHSCESAPSGKRRVYWLESRRRRLVLASNHGGEFFNRTKTKIRNKKKKCSPDVQVNRRGWPAGSARPWPARCTPPAGRAAGQWAGARGTARTRSATRWSASGWCSSAPSYLVPTHTQSVQ